MYVSIINIELIYVPYYMNYYSKYRMELCTLLCEYNNLFLLISKVGKVRSLLLFCCCNLHLMQVICAVTAHCLLLASQCMKVMQLLSRVGCFNVYIVYCIPHCKHIIISFSTIIIQAYKSCLSHLSTPGQEVYTVGQRGLLGWY